MTAAKAAVLSHVEEWRTKRKNIPRKLCTSFARGSRGAVEGKTVPEAIIRSTVHAVLDIACPYSIAGALFVVITAVCVKNSEDLGGPRKSASCWLMSLTNVWCPFLI